MSASDLQDSDVRSTIAPPDLNDMRLSSFLLVLLLVPCTPAATLLAVFAHPDDETSVGRVLARYAAEGHDVHLVTTTSGQAGVANTDIPAGPQLGAAREKEARCSAQKLGIHEPILLQFQDGKVYESATMQGIRDRLRDIVEELKPDVMITWGPDGATGHRDHRLVGDIATQVFLSSDTQHRMSRLYFVALPASLPVEEPGQPGVPARMARVDDRFITAEIDGSKYGAQELASMQCHMTQWAPLENINSMFELFDAATGGKTFFREMGRTLRPGEARDTTLLPSSR